MVFLKKAIELSTTSVYSLHKSSTRQVSVTFFVVLRPPPQHIADRATAWGCSSEVVATMKFDIPAVHKHHRKATLDVEVDFWRFGVGEGSDDGESEEDED
jgi:predicted RNA methylase